jgi:hypothetical protein
MSDPPMAAAILSSPSAAPIVQLSGLSLGLPTPTVSCLSSPA